MQQYGFRQLLDDREVILITWFKTREVKTSERKAQIKNFALHQKLTCFGYMIMNKHLKNIILIACVIKILLGSFIRYTLYSIIQNKL